MDKEYVILGIHDREVTTVNVYEDIKNDNGDVVGNRLVKERNVARVRMMVGDKQVDEDFDLPSLPLSAMGLDKAVLTQIYEELLKEPIEKRIDEIESGVLDASESKVVDEQVEQVVINVEKPSTAIEVENG